MTNEEAVKELKALLNMCDPSPLTKELEDALKMAIKALEQQPSEDAVSRTEAIDKLTKFYNMVLDDNGTKLNIRDIVGTLERLPSVTPKPSEDCISRESVLKFIDKMPSELTSDGRRMIRRRALEEYISDTLPSVTPQRDVGKWIKVYPLGKDYEAYMCSKCKTGDWDITIGEYKFCPYCGQKKEGVEDGEDSAFD